MSTMSTMRASVMPDFERQPTLADVPMPEAGPGEVLVRVHAASVNGVDLSIASGQLQGMMEYRFPVVLGKDFAGTVEAVGDGVSGFAAGVLGLAGSAALQAVDAVAPEAGETVLISGATGGVGAYAVQLAAARGATVIATAQPGEEEDFVRDLGASHTVDYTGEVAEQVREIRPGGVEAVLHFAGDGAVLGELLVEGGRLASTLIMSPDQLPVPNASVSGVFANPDAATLDRLAAEVAGGRLETPIQQTYALNRVDEAFAAFAAGTRGKLAVSVS
jgi:NADPH:quinone reductase-like Zn-dependent oxidoreductase